MSEGLLCHGKARLTWSLLKHRALPELRLN